MSNTDNGAFGNTTVRVMGEAFDTAWAVIGGAYSDPATIAERRTRLASIILELTRAGERDQRKIAAEAVRLMGQ